MKGIVITASREISVMEFAEPLYKTVGSVVGGYIEHVKPSRLEEPYCMIVNEDGHMRDLPTNPIGCYLYETDKHGYPILGDIVIMEDGFRNGEPDIVGISDEAINGLYQQFKENFYLKEKEGTHEFAIPLTHP